MNLLLLLYGLAVIGLTITEYKQRFRAQYVLKPLCAIGFLTIAVVCGAFQSVFGLLIFTALGFCAIGDVLLLNRRSSKIFQMGMLAFMLGHIFYTAAALHLPQSIFTQLKSNDQSLFVYGIAAVLSLSTFWVWRSLKKSLPHDMKVAVGLYVIIILTMLICYVVGISPTTWILPLAALMFATSDYFVGRDRFVSPNPKNALAITPLYFGAQALFAQSAGLLG